MHSKPHLNERTRIVGLRVPNSDQAGFPVPNNQVLIGTIRLNMPVLHLLVKLAGITPFGCRAVFPLLDIVHER